MRFQASGPSMATTNADHLELDALSCHSKDWIHTDLESDIQEVLKTDEDHPSEDTIVNVLSAHTIREHIQRDIELHPIHKGPLLTVEVEDGMSVEYIDDEDVELPNSNEQAQCKLTNCNENDETRNNADFEEYLMSVAVVSSNEKDAFKTPPCCSQCRHNVPSLLANSSDLLRHTTEHYDSSGEWSCCLGGDDHRRTFEDKATLINHWFLEHNDILNVGVSFKCPTCIRRFANVVEFGKHICRLEALSGVPATTVVCDTCSLSFITHRRWQFHMVHQHQDQAHNDSVVNRRQLCLACGLTAVDDDHRFYEHVQFEHERFQLCVCRTCDRCFTNTTEFANHQLRHTREQLYKCSECDARFTERKYLNQHQTTHRSKRLQCAHCEKSFKRAPILRQHINRQHTEYERMRLPVCSACGEVFTGRKSATDAKCHSACPETLRPSADFTDLLCCEFCERSFATVAHLCAHRERPHHTTSAVAGTPVSQPAFTCSLCQLTFDTFAKRAAHSRVHRNDPDRPNATRIRRCYVCPVPDCGRIFSDWQTLQQHRKSAHLIQPTVMRCNDCEMVFYQSWRLAHHRRAVHSERLGCPLCTATFIQKSSLNVHLRRIHIEHRPIGDVRRYRDGLIGEYFRVEPTNGSFTCVKCGKNVALRKNAIAHAQAVHLRIREFACDGGCELRFYSQSDLRKHQRRRHVSTKTASSSNAIGDRCDESSRKSPAMLECW